MSLADGVRRWKKTWAHSTPMLTSMHAGNTSTAATGPNRRRRSAATPAIIRKPRGTATRMLTTQSVRRQLLILVSSIC